MLKENKKILLPIMILVILILLVGIISAVSSSINIDVINTRDLKVDFVPIDEKSSIFDGTVANNTEFIRSTFPLAGERLITGTNYEILSSSFGLVLEDDEKFRLLKDVYKKGRLSRSTDRVVGIVPDGWFSAHGQGDLKGYTSFGKIFGIAYGTKSVIIEESYMHGVAHEIGHTFGLCDEYSTTEWNIQNNLFGGCPNGDSNNDNELDSICLEYPTGCPVSTFGELVPWNSTNDTINLFNLMGSSNEEKARWISKDSYTHLLDLLSSSLDFLSVDFGVLMSGTVDKEGNVDIDDYSYVLNEKSILNESSEGNYTIFIEENGSILHKMSFEPQFYIMNIGGNLTEVNVSAFSFVLPFSDNVTRIYVEKNNITKDEIIRTPNTPSLQITTDLSDQIFSDEFNVIWDSSDLDEDELVYA
ncbi:hypothetical protein GOV12_04910, partial [Candidatus Pacearchaeota archaeon]|nr:hypothetical protein [Candidatus Pacearchaeota archaeon]